MENIKVSVILAVYNGEKYISQALDTIVNQTLRDIEIICVDDGSTDGTVKILESYAERDGRVKVLHHMEKTDGAAAARNMGLSVARGEFLSFFDADDYFELDLLDKAYRKAIEDSADIVIYDAYVYDDLYKGTYGANWTLNKNNIPTKNTFSPQENPDKLFRMTMGSAWLCMFRRKLIIDNHIQFESIHHTDDQVFVCLAYCYAHIISILDEKLVYYRKNISTSQSAMAHLHPEAGYMAAYVLKEKLIERGLYEQFATAVAVLGLELAQWHLIRMKTVENFIKLYDKLKEEYLVELGTLELSGEIVGNDLIEWREDILGLEPMEYLLKKINPIEGGMELILKQLPQINWGSRVIIYGGGVFGRWLFSTVQENQCFNIVSWVDRNYNQLGFPFKSVDSIECEEYDYILVAIKQQSTFLAIKKSLVEMGVPENKLCWINEIA